MNKISKYILLSFFVFSASAICSREFGESFDEKLSVLEIKVEDVITENDTLKTEVIETTSARPNLTEKQWMVNWDILLWHAKVGGTSFAFINERPAIDLPIQGFTKRIDFNWDWGFRVGVGRHFEHDKWSGFINFTYYKAADSSKLSGSPISFITPIRGSYAEAAQRAKSAFSLDFYNLDVDLYRHYFISHGVSLKPSIGLKNTWLDMTQTTRYNDGEYLNNNTAETIDVSDLWGIGPKAGFESTWYLNHGFNVFGIFSASLIYGYFRVSQESSISPTQENTFYIRDRFHRFVPNAQLYLGLGYGRYIRDEKYYIDVKLGYECQYYWRANQMINLQRFESAYRYDSFSEDVSMHGVTFKLKVTF